MTVATITKTPSNTWKAVVRKRGWPVTIKTFRTKRDAADWARSTEDEMVRGVYINRVGAERLLFDKALKKKFDAYSLAAITPDLVAEYRDERLAAGKSADTVRLELALLSHLFTIAIKEWRLGLIYNPVSNIRKPAPGKGRDRRLGADEEKGLLRACDRHSNPMLGWIVRVALYTGMRAGEIKGLTRRQANLDNRTIHLTETKNGSSRTVPLTREAAAVLRLALNNPVRPIDTDLIFFGEPGRDKVRRPYEFRPAWHRTLKQAGIQGLRFHDLRHEAVSRLVEAGLGDQEVATISGHKSMQMLRRYTHLRAEDLVSRLDQLGLR